MNNIECWIPLVRGYALNMETLRAFGREVDVLGARY